LNLWDASEFTELSPTARLIRKYRAHNDAVEYVTFIDANEAILSVGRDGTVKLWPAADFQSDESLNLVREEYSSGRWHTTREEGCSHPLILPKESPAYTEES